jgi:3-hydroxymyristoyl/3-hydroxydecanoyl-(acyl carrier protein) dehydratase
MPYLSSVLEVPALVDIDATFLPVGQMRQIARVTIFAGDTIEGEMDLGPGHWVYPQHFPDDPIFPGTLLIEAAGQLVALFAWMEGRRGYPRLVRTGADFHRPVGPEVSGLRLRAVVQRKRHLYFGNVQILAGETLVATVEAVLVVLTSR